MKKRLTRLPIFGLRKDQSSTSEQIFRILADRYPINMSTLQHELKSQFNQRLSYQAVRKSVLGLRQLGVIESSSKGYRLSVDWLLECRSLIDNVLLKCRASEGTAIEPREDYQFFEVESLYEADMLWGDLVMSLFRLPAKSGPREFLSINHFPWWLPINTGREIEFCRALSKRRVDSIFAFTETGPSIKWASNFYKSMGVSVIRCRHSIPSTHYYNVIGDKVIEVVLPGSLERQIRNAFVKAKNPGQVPIKMWSDLGARRGKIRISIQRSVAIADGLRELAIEKAV